MIKPVQINTPETKQLKKICKNAKRICNANLKKTPLKFSFEETFESFKNHKKHNYKTFGKDWFLPKDNIFFFEGVLLSPDSLEFRQFVNKHQKEFKNYARL